MRSFRLPARAALPVTAGLVLLGGSLTQVAALHAADVTWCFGDPVISVDGQQNQYIVGVQGKAASLAAAGVVANVIVYVPEGVSTSVVTPPSDSPFRETLSFVTRGTYSGQGPIPVEVQVTFTSSTKLAASLQANYRNGATQTVTGTTQGALTVNHFD